MKMNPRFISTMLIIGISGAFFLGSADVNSAPKKMTKNDALPVAEYLIRPLLKDPDSAKFSGIIFHAGTANSSPIICGYVNSRMTGRQRFVTGGTVILEEQIGTKNMNIAWKRFC